MQLDFADTIIAEAIRDAVRDGLERAGVMDEIKRCSAEIVKADGLMDKAAAAAYLGGDLSERTIDAWMDPKTAPKRRPLPYRKIGHIVRFSRRELDAWSATFTINPVG